MTGPVAAKPHQPPALDPLSVINGETNKPHYYSATFLVVFINT